MRDPLGSELQVLFGMEIAVLVFLAMSDTSHALVCVTMLSFCDIYMYVLCSICVCVCVISFMTQGACPVSVHHQLSIHF